MSVQTVARKPAIGAALQRALTALRGAQRGDHWVGELSSSALATAMSMTALHVVDSQQYRGAIARAGDWLAHTQHADGGWGDAVVDVSNVNATSLSLAALALTHSDDSACVERALCCLEQHFGGLEAVGDPARCTLSGPCRTVSALAGLMDWRTIKCLRPEVILLPARLRRTISTTFPAYLSIATLHASRAPHPLNRLPTYAVARRRAQDWLMRAQGPDGSFEESAFLTSVIVTCLAAAGHRDLPWLAPAIDFVVNSQRDDGSWPIDRDLETFDTDLAVAACTEAGIDVPHSLGVRDWLLGQQTTAACFATGAPSGGWPWAQPSGWPDTDDTAYTVIALRGLGLPVDAPALRDGSEWLTWMQDAGGAWSTFVRGSRMPFDHDCPYVTGHALSALRAVGAFAHATKRLDRALDYLQRVQRPDGSFASIWFREKTAGTASVLEALCELDLSESGVAVRAREALRNLQNDDGGWGGIRGDASTAEETAWAVMSLLADDDVADNDDLAERIERGLDWLVGHQRPNGAWGAWPIGLYYSAMWYSDSMYALAWPAKALARAVRKGFRGCGLP
jgi:squalene-hopene/tetraprenyl-beta-curcumene cyclase